jgi:hypothetical protein
MGNVTDMRERRLRQRAEALDMELIPHPRRGGHFVLKRYNDPPQDGELAFLEAVIADMEAEARG